MTTLLIVFGVLLLQMFLLLGGVIGYLTYGHMSIQASALPNHPEFYDGDGNVIPDDILAIRFENSYDNYQEWDDED